MTLHEIEEALATLSSRHAPLDEGMLVTLLRAGGWEEKDIQDAIIIFRGGTLPVEVEPAQKPKEEPKMLPDGVEDGLLLVDHNEDVPAPVGEEAAAPAPESPESLVVPQVAGSQPQREELPHNLPLRPFETSEHIWPFSRYRDVFFGEEVSPVKAKPSVQPEVVAPTVQQSAPQIGTFAPMKDVVDTTTIRVAVKEKGEEKLVMLASFMLLIVLLLLGYMYGNGRL